MLEVQVYKDLRQRYEANAIQMKAFGGQESLTAASSGWKTRVTGSMKCLNSIASFDPNLPPDCCNGCYWNSPESNAGCEIIAPESNLFVRNLRDGTTEVNGQKYSHVSVDIGGATLLASLRLVNGRRGDNACIIIDPKADLTAKLLTNLQEGNTEKLVELILNDPAYDQSKSGNYRESIKNEFMKWYGFVNTNLRDIYCLNTQMPFDTMPAIANLVTCYFPHPAIMSPAMVLTSARQLLKEGGSIELVTENVEYYHNLSEILEREGIKYNMQTGYPDSRSLPLSIYDILFRIVSPYRASFHFEIYL